MDLAEEIQRVKSKDSPAIGATYTMYTTIGQSGNGENGTMYNGGGLGQKGAGVSWRSSAGFEESLKVFEGVSKGSKMF